MPTARTRTLLAVIAAAAVVGYGLSGHGPPQMQSHDGMAGAAAGLCVLLSAALRQVTAVRPYSPSFPLVAPSPRIPVGRPGRALLDGKARASPISLQRFRN